MRWVLSGVVTLCLSAVVLASPQGDDLPAGKGKDAFLKMCVNCHSLDRVTGVKYTRKRWANVVDDMVGRGAEGSEEEINAVVSYLSRNFGKPVNINTATAKEIETGLSFTAPESEAVVKYRTDHGAFKAYEELTKVPGLNADRLDEQKKNIQF